MIDKIIPIRMTVYEEVLGADLVEHRIRHTKVRSPYKNELQYILSCIS